jgi:penicillin-binding protein 1B
VHLSRHARDVGAAASSFPTAAQLPYTRDVVASRPPRPTARRSNTSAASRPRPKAGQPRWLRSLLIAAAALGVLTVGTTAYLWVSYGRLIDRRLAGEQHPVPRIFGRPFEVRVGQGLSPTQFVQRLNDVGYAERQKASAPGEFTQAPLTVTLVTRPADNVPSRTIKVDFSRGNSPTVTRLSAAGNPIPSFSLEAPLLAALAPGERRRYVPIARIPKVMIDAVLAIEDRRFYEHPGVDPIGSIGAIITNLRGNRPYLVGGSTLTQQIVKNTFLTPEKTLRRKLQEQFMALVLESRFTKQQILELYLNDVVLGQRGPFEIHGVSEASRIFFAKDVQNLTLAEAATIAGIIQSPSRLSPFRNGDRARERRNVVLHEMADGGMVSKTDADAAIASPLVVSTRALENEAPYFVDYASQLVEEGSAGLLKSDAAVDVYTTLDLHLQRFAQEAVGEGAAQLDKQLAAKKRKGTPEVALLAIDPRSGEILAMVGGRGYTQSQYNRSVTARRQPGSVFKPFVYLSAFQNYADTGHPELTPATIINDEPTTFKDGENDYTPSNYQDEYDGPITLRKALALSHNIVAIKVAEQTGYDRVADLWKKIGVGTAAKPFPSIALGVFEASPIEMATAYTIFANGGVLHPLQALTKIVENGKARSIPAPPTRVITRPDTTFLVTNMMRSVLNEGTGATARSLGFTLDAAGKTGTTNDLRDAWFIGFTPDLLAVVWVGFDNNQPIGLSGGQAAVPIWTAFMKRATSGRSSVPFTVPEGVVFADIDKDTGQLATPSCPVVFHEAFLAGTEPKQTCETHGGGSGGLRTVLSKLGGWLGLGR